MRCDQFHLTGCLALYLAAVTSVSRARELPLADVAELRALSPEAVALRPAVRVRAGRGDEFHGAGGGDGNLGELGTGAPGRDLDGG